MTVPTPTPGPGVGYGSQQLAASLQALQANPQSGGGGKAGLTGSTPVYLGSLTAGTQGPNYGILAPTNRGNLFKTDSGSTGYGTYDSAKAMPLQWNDSILKQFVNTGILNKVPGFNGNMGMPEIMSAWDDLVQASIAFNQSDPNRKWTPWDVLNTYKTDGKFGTIRKGDWEYDVATGEKVKYVGPKTKTQTDKRIDLSSAEDVKALTTQVLTQTLGRAPTAQELAQYKATLNAQEQANPTLTTQTQTLNDMGEVVNTATTQSGGLSAEAKAGLVSDKSKQGPEYGKYQAATTYYNAMMQMISGGG